MSKNYTISDIARMANVSKGTVDRVIHKRGKVSKEALEKVTKVLDEINYQPNIIARRLKNNKIYNLCVFLPDPTKDPYWLPCIEGIDNATREFQSFGVTVEKKFFDPLSTEDFIKKTNEIITSPPDGVLIAPLFYNEAYFFLQKCQEMNIPFNTFNSSVDVSGTKCFIGQDLVQSGRVAANLLSTILDKNSHIGIVHIEESFQNAIHMQRKEEGFRNYFDELSVNDYFVSTFIIKPEDPNDLKKSITAFLNDNPELSGIFITNSKAHLIADVLKQKNQKMHFIGYDLLDKNIDHLNSGVIDFLIHQNPKEQTYIGLSYLAEYFAFGKQIQKQKLLPIDIVTSENLKYYLD